LYTVTEGAGALSNSSQLVGHRRAAECVSDDTAWQRPADLKLEWKEMAPRLESIAMLLLPLQK
jgi:hypothetical protein